MAKKAKSTGRPSIYTDEMGEEICQRIAEGESLRSIAKDERMPSLQTILQWAMGFVAVPKEARFPEQYARARMIRSELYADEVIALADEIGVDPQRSRLQVDTRKWIASKLLPKTYGDKLALTGEDGGPVVSRVEVVIVDGEGE